MILRNNQRNAKRTLTADGRHRVFAYGSLRNWDRPVIQVRGMLCLRPSGQAAVDFSEPSLWTNGEILEVTDDELRQLDAREGACARCPWYERIIVKARDGSVCWAYQWARPFSGFRVLGSGEWSFQCLRIHVPRYGSRNTIKSPHELK
jgi:gamma-glutamylcyclotransferase (GGCT)/AIG2-like uncharacterized protein YtfP